MEVITRVISPEEEGSTVRHILRAKLHFSSHAISRLTRAENGILVNGAHARTTYILHTGDILAVESGDHRPPKVEVIPGDWPLPVVWEDGHLLVVVARRKGSCTISVKDGRYSIDNQLAEAIVI